MRKFDLLLFCGNEEKLISEWSSSTRVIVAYVRKTYGKVLQVLQYTYLVSLNNALVSNSLFPNITFLC